MIRHGRDGVLLEQPSLTGFEPAASLAEISELLQPIAACAIVFVHIFRRTVELAGIGLIGSGTVKPYA